MLQLAGAAFIAVGFWAWSEKVSVFLVTSPLLTSLYLSQLPSSVPICPYPSSSVHSSPHLSHLSMLFAGRPAGSHPGHSDAWLRPRVVGPGSGRSHLHPGLRWLCGGTEGEHLPAQVCTSGAFDLLRPSARQVLLVS